MGNMDSVTAQERTALVLLAKAMLDQIDEIASIKAQGGKATISSAILAEMGSVLKEVEPRIQQCFLEMIPILSADMSPRQHITVNEESASIFNQPRRGLLEKLREELGVKAA